MQDCTHLVDPGQDRRPRGVRVGQRQREGVARELLAARALDLVEDGRARGRGRDEGAAVLRVGRPEHGPGDLAGAVERRRAAGGVAHAQRVVDQDDLAGPPSAHEPLLEAGGVEHRARQEQEQEDGQGDPQEQEQQLLDLDPPPVALDGQLQVAHRRPLHPAEPAAVQQVDDDGDGAQQRPPDQQWAQEAEHGSGSPARVMGRLLAGAEEAGERIAQMLVGAEADVVVAPAAALAADAVEEFVHRPLVRPPEGTGLGEELLVPLDVVEDGRAVEGQVELVAVEHLEDQHLVAQEAEPVQAVVHGLEVGEQVGDDHQEAAAADPVR